MNHSPYLPIAYFNGDFIPFGEANVSIATHALQYGSGVFGGIRGYVQPDTSVHIFRLNDHVQRIRRSARLIGISIDPDEEKLTKIIIELVKRNQPAQNFYIRPFAYKSGLDLPPGMHGVADGLAIYMASLGKFLGTDEKGVLVKVSSWRRVSDTAVSARGKISGAYTNSSLAKDEAVELGYDDAILLNESGSVAEASTCNLFMVRDGQLVTPPVSENILEGITRKSVMQLAKDLGIEVVERTINRTELYIADEVVLCGTAVELSWVSKVDNQVVGSGQKGEVFSKLSKAFHDILTGKSDTHKDWLTSVSW